MELEQIIIQIIQKSPSISVAQICRTINERGISYCTKKKCYANPRKRNKFVTTQPICKYRLQLIYNKIIKLEEENIIKTKRIKKTDSRQARGWDWMRACYLIEDFPEEINQTKMGASL